MKDRFKVPLSPEEEDLVRRIEFDAHRLNDREHYLENGDLALNLVRSLQSRKAIPAHRWSWFFEPEYNIGGRGSSRRDIFEKNGTSGNDIARHAHFLPHLHYFIYGPNLLAEVIDAFLSKVDECGNVTSSDVIPLGKTARQLTKNAGLDRKKSAEEFFRLALELDLGAGTGLSIRNQVMRA